MTIKEMLAALQTKNAALGEATKAFEALPQDTPAEVRTKQAEALTTAKAEVEKLTNELGVAVEAAKKANRTATVIADAEELERVVPPVNRLAAQARDHGAENEAECKAFIRYMKGGKALLATKEIEALTPQSTAWNRGSEGLRMPTGIVARMFGPEFVGGMAGRLIRAVPMLSSSNADGGYTVPQDFRRTLLQLPAEMPVLFPRCTVLPSPTGTLTIPRLKQTDANEYGGVVVGWTNEGGAKKEVQAEFEQVEIAAHEVSAYTELSLRLLSRSAFDLEALLGNLFRAALLDALDQAIITGSGTGQPAGIVGTAGIRSVTRNTAGTVVYDDLVSLMYALKPYHRANALFVVGDDVLRALALKKDSLGRPIFTASTANGIFDRLVGLPFVPTTRTPAIGLIGDVICIDPTEYYVGMEQEVVVKRSDEYKFRNNVAAIAAFMVVGGQLVQPRVASVLTGPS